MTAVPPPYAPRDLAQVPQASSGSSAFQTASSAQFEFSESTAVTLEWRLNGLKAMFDSTKGETKSSAVFGDVDNLWEVLWYPNSGAAGGENASLYLSCTPTPQELEAGTSQKWTRKGLWWFRFEIRSTSLDERTGKPHILATKDAADHTFALKTANWGWQQFSQRRTLFHHPAVLATDSFVIVCTVQAQPQPPAGYWLGMGLPPSQWTPASTVVGANAKVVGSGGGLSAWSGGEGASGGVAGGTTAGGGVKKVVPRDLISGVGALLDDPLYSDVEFIIPSPRSRRRDAAGGGGGESSGSGAPRRIYANKKLLERCDYFHAMFRGGFREVEGQIDEDDYDDDLDSLSDSDAEDEAAEYYPSASGARNISPASSRPGSIRPGGGRKTSVSGDRPDEAMEHRDHTGVAGTGEDEHMGEGDNDASGPGGDGRATHEGEGEGAGEEGAGITPMDIVAESTTGLAGEASKAAVGTGVVGRDNREVGADRSRMLLERAAAGPKKTKVVVRDAAWSTWWAVLFWLYTDSIYFAPLTSTFTHPSPHPNTAPGSAGAPAHSRPNSISSLPVSPSARFRTRAEWIRVWMDEHDIASSSFFSGNGDESGNPVGPRPVSAKAIYRLADKLDLPALKLRAFQHITSELTSQNVPAEVFSRFSSTFEDVRKVQVAYFLKHWAEIKKSTTMMQIWQQIRNGKHVGFEEVWPLIVSQLDFKPS